MTDLPLMANCCTYDHGTVFIALTQQAYYKILCTIEAGTWLYSLLIGYKIQCQIVQCNQGCQILLELV